MAVVMSGTASNGAKWRIHDDAYINASPEELERRRLYACEIAHRILVEEYRRNQRAHQAGAAEQK